MFADEPVEIRAQAKEIASWGDNVNVKIPVTTTRGESLSEVARDLCEDGVHLNVTALFTTDQVTGIGSALAGGAT